MNQVELIGFYGDDATIACSAWTSTSRELTEDKKNRISKLINMLWSEGHETPFEKGVVHFLVDTDIASHIHLLKHRISSLNAESARYKELKEDKYYLPEDWGGIEVSDILDEFEFFYTIDPELHMDWKETLERYTELGNKLYHQCIADLEPVLGRKRTKESARFFKTYNSQIQADVMFNMRSFANFVKLRNTSSAQLEIKEVAAEMLRIITEVAGEPFKETLNAFDKKLRLEDEVKQLVKTCGNIEEAIKIIKGVNDEL
jgi:thymidylate synthase (FAD)